MPAPTSRTRDPHHGSDDLELIGSAAARRIALAAQGFGGRRSALPPPPRRLRALAEQLGVVQIDSVNVLSRSHYLPFFARLGPYDRDGLDRLARTPRLQLAEYWVHEASFVPPATLPLLRWRMERAHQDAWAGVRAAGLDLPGTVRAVTDVIRDCGPSTSAQVETALASVRGPRGQAWGWNWSDTKRALEFAFWAGVLTSAGRTSQFERRYELPERALPPDVAAAPTPERADAVRALVAEAARALGVATAASLRDYHRLRPGDARPAIADLVEAGSLRPVLLAPHPRAAAEGARPEPAYLYAAARRPGVLSARALLSPFDSLVWHRPRTERTFGMRYRLEIYTPAAQRVHGYYVLPFLLGDDLVARVDLKADRAVGTDGTTGALRVRSAWAQSPVPGARGRPRPAGEVAAQLLDELRVMAAWLGLGRVAVEPVGDLAPALVAATAGT